MLLREGEFEVSKNLHDFLDSLRSRVEDTGEDLAGWRNSEHLWIDQLCIDQRSTTERKQQVPLMKSIYKGAETVIIWLGMDASIETTMYILRLKLSWCIVVLFSCKANVGRNSP